MEDSYKYKYLKYKHKYLKLKGGVPARVPEAIIKYDNTDFFLDFNNQKNTILEKYNNFTNLNLINNEIERLHIGGNGTVHNLIFTKSINFRRKDKINLIMKTPVDSYKDNNYYEYVAGLCVNNFKTYFPNFVYTFGYGKITPTLKSALELDPYVNINPRIFMNNYTIIDVNEDDTLKYSKINDGCELNGSTSLLIEKIPNSKELWDYIFDDEFTEPASINYNLFCVLYQVYLTLNSLSEKFTHYDLHTGNIMISEYDKPIIIKYILKNGEEIELCTKYIPVIIDYGRCFISCLENDSLINSTNYLNIACNISNCRYLDTNYNNCELTNGLHLNKKYYLFVYLYI